MLTLVDWIAELLWFRALGYEDVFWRLLFASVAMFAIAFIPVFAYVLLNLLVLARLAAVPQPNGRRFTPLLIIGSIATAAFFGFLFSGEWDRFLRLVWAQDFGSSDPIYFRDIGFYLFVLPFLNLVQTRVVLLTLGGTLLLALAYFWMGGLRFDARRYVAADPKVLRHLIANAVLLLSALAFGYYLDRFGLLTRSAGAVFGAGYTDIHVLLVGLWVALAATVALICVLIWVAATNTPRFAVFGVGVYLIILLAALEVIPAGFQRLIVEPNELALETPFLRHNIALTRAAYGLDNIDVRFHSTEAKLDIAQLRENQSTIDNIRIWDHRPLSQTFRQLQQIRTYYAFSDVDVDRYSLILGPLQIEAMIDQDTTIARQLTLWDQRGSRVTRGNLLVIPIDESLSLRRAGVPARRRDEHSAAQAGYRQRRQPPGDGIDAGGCLASRIRRATVHARRVRR